MSALSERPVGTRRSWRRKVLGPEIGHAMLAKLTIFPAEMSPPTEAQMFTDRRGRVRRVEVAYTNGRTLSFRRRSSGWSIVWAWSRKAAA